MKTLRCSDLGRACGVVMTAPTTSELMQAAARHLRLAHGVIELTAAQRRRLAATLKKEVR